MKMKQKTKTNKQENTHYSPIGTPLDPDEWLEIFANMIIDRVIEEEKLYKELKEKTFNWLRLMNPDALPNISDKDFLDVLLAGSIASSVWQVHGAIS